MRHTGSLAAALIAAAMACGSAHAAVVTYHASLDAAKEVPPTMSHGTGIAAVNFDTKTDELSWRVDYKGMTGPLIAAHIHCGAGPKANAPVAVSFGSKLGDPIVGSGKMTAAQAAELEGGKCYVNLHTAKNKPGEIRGQLEKAP